jgi:hypothetical protein
MFLRFRRLACLRLRSSEHFDVGKRLLAFSGECPNWASCNAADGRMDLRQLGSGLERMAALLEEFVLKL